ncbi:MAG: VOC family protein [Gemmatimonadota bacterium]
MMQQPAPRIGGILETCLYAPNLLETANFYEHVLRLEVFARMTDRHVFFRCGQAVFLLFDPQQTALPKGDVPGHGASGEGHVAFAIPEAELDSWRARFAREGVQIEAEVNWPVGGVSLYVRDPAGNSVELATPSIWAISEEVFRADRPER